MDQTDHNQEKHEEEPKIFGVYIDNKNNKRFNRRDFIKSATLVGTTVALTGCNLLDSGDEEEMAEALQKTLQAMEAEEAEETEVIATEEEEPTATQTNTPTKLPTKTPTKKPTRTPTRKPTRTPTEIPTDTEVPFARGEVTFAHNIFKGPHVDHPIITKTVVGEEVTILGRTSDGVWYKITDSEGTTGWVFSEFIKLLNDIHIPVIYDIPTQVPAPCDCDAHVEPPPCSCDAHSSGGGACTCDEVCTCDLVHYWYPD